MHCIEIKKLIKMQQLLTCVNNFLILEIMKSILESVNIINNVLKGGMGDGF